MQGDVVGSLRNRLAEERRRREPVSARHRSAGGRDEIGGRSFRRYAGGRLSLAAGSDQKDQDECCPASPHEPESSLYDEMNQLFDTVPPPLRTAGQL